MNIFPFPEILKPVLDHPFKDDICFLCARKLTDINWTNEDVIPMWAQTKFNLRNKSLRLLNKSSIQYRQLKIPCCDECNNNTLSQLELKISNGIENGYDEFIRIPRFTIFRWLAKIFLGILFKESQLPQDRTKHDIEKIIVPSRLNKYALLHFWLLLSNYKNQSDFCPGSLFIFKTQMPEEIEQQFDLFDDAYNGVIVIRIGEVGLVADFLENGIHYAACKDFYYRFKKYPLHPEQFKEVAVKILYNASLLRIKSNVQFYSQENKVGYVIEWKSRNVGNTPFREWNQEEYATWLSYYVDIPKEVIFQPPNKVRSITHDDKGEPIYWEYGKEFPLQLEIL